MTESSQNSGYLRQAWLVILLALLYGGALAGVQTTLGPIIEENKRNETYEKIPELVLGPEKATSVKVEIEEVEVVDANEKPQTVYRAKASDGATLGWVLPASGQGFADRIDLLVGLDAELATITGMFVLDQKETPNLGNYITDAEKFRNQFIGLGSEKSIRVVKTDAVPARNEIRALTGATISSESVADIVNKAVANLKGPIRDADANSSPTGSSETETPTPVEE